MSKKIRWGVLGTAKIARQSLIPAMRSASNAEVVAVASRDHAKAQAFARELEIPLAFGSYEELIRSSEVDAIYIPLPVAMHARYSIQCAEAGKPCLCEKPLTTDLAEARRIVDAFRGRGVVLAEAIMYHFHPLTLKVLELVRGGAVGKVQFLRSCFHITIAPDDSNIRMKKETGGGAMLDTGCYCVSVMRLLAGEEPTCVQAVGNFGKESQVDEEIAGTLLFPSGAVGQFTCGLHTPFACEYHVIGDKGRLSVERGAMCAWPGEAFVIKHWNANGYEEITVPPANHYQLMVEDFCSALLEGRSPRVPLDETLKNMEVIERVLNSARSAIVV